MALLYAGADIDRASGDGTTPLQIATMNGHFDLALLLVERGADPRRVHTLAKGPAPQAGPRSKRPACSLAAA